MKRFFFILMFLFLSVTNVRCSKETNINNIQSATNYSDSLQTVLVDNYGCYRYNYIVLPSKQDRNVYVNVDIILWWAFTDSVWQYESEILPHQDNKIRTTNFPIGIPFTYKTSGYKWDVLSPNGVDGNLYFVVADGVRLNSSDFSLVPVGDNLWTIDFTMLGNLINIGGYVYKFADQKELLVKRGK